jgi:DNA-binding NarL/FixJ family response regulator
MSIRALIVDDEPLARQSLRRFLKYHSDIGLLGECGDGQSASILRTAAVQRHISQVCAAFTPRFMVSLRTKRRPRMSAYATFFRASQLIASKLRPRRQASSYAFSMQSENLIHLLNGTQIRKPYNRFGGLPCLHTSPSSVGRIRVCRT